MQNLPLHPSSVMTPHAGGQVNQASLSNLSSSLDALCYFRLGIPAGQIGTVGLRSDMQRHGRVNGNAICVHACA
jgi:hypothetical protein